MANTRIKYALFYVECVPPGRIFANETRALLAVMISLTAIVVVFLVVHSFVKEVTVDTTTVALVGLLIVIWLLPFATSLKLPGGASVELRDLEAASAKVEAVESATARPVISPVKRPAQSEGITWKDLLDTDVNIALAGLRIEIERRIRELGHLADVAGRSEREYSLGDYTRRLSAAGVLTRLENEAIMSVVEVCNRAVHAKEVSAEAANRASRLGDFVIDLLDRKIGEMERPSQGSRNEGGH